MDSKLNPYVLTAPCLVASAALFFFGTGLTPIWQCTWLAPIPLLWLSPRVSGRHAFFLSISAYALGGLNEWNYSNQVLPTWSVASRLLLGACLFGIGTFLFRRNIIRKKIWQGVLIFPAFWVIVEYLTSVISVHGTFGDIAYSQMNFLPVVQIASVVGIWGISFCIFLFAATAAVALSGDFRLKGIPIAIVACLFLACVFIYGMWRLHSTDKNSPTMKVALMGSSANGNFFAGSPEQLDLILARYADAMKEFSGQGVQLIVLPEHTGPITDSSEMATDSVLGNMAKDSNAYISIGVERIGATLSRNQERLYAQNGRLVATYNKHHMLPPYESQFTPDSRRTVLNEPSGRWGVEICKDMDFPNLSREYSNDGIGMLIVSASDFVADGWLHGRMAVLRGVEGGFSIARSADLGILTATDDRGRILAEKNTVLGPPLATEIATIPVHHDVTIYSRFGNGFAWLCFGLVTLSWLIPSYRSINASEEETTKA